MFLFERSTLLPQYNLRTPTTATRPLIAATALKHTNAALGSQRAERGRLHSADMTYEFFTSDTLFLRLLDLFGPRSVLYASCAPLACRKGRCARCTRCSLTFLACTHALPGHCATAEERASLSQKETNLSVLPVVLHLSTSAGGPERSHFPRGCHASSLSLHSSR